MEHHDPDTEKGINYLEKVIQESRRDWMFKLGAGLNALAGILLAVPLVGFVFSSLGSKQSPQSWIGLGKVDDYPENQTRMATYRNPYTRPWTAKQPKFRAGCGGLKVASFRCLQLTAHTWDAQSAGFRSRAFSCVLVMAASTTRMDRGLRGRHEVCSSMSTRSKRGGSGCVAARCQLLPSRFKHAREPI